MRSWQNFKIASLFLTPTRQQRAKMAYSMPLVCLSQNCTFFLKKIEDSN